MNLVWSRSRVGTGLALAAWAVTFWLLIAGDRVSFYFSSRTTWLAPVGAVILTIAMVSRLVSARVPHPEPLTRRQYGILAALIAPAVLIAALPPAALGSYAVSRRDSSVKGAYVSTNGLISTTGDLSLLDIFGLMYRGELKKLAPRAGTSSSFTGFVTTDPADEAGEFRLTRFYISCCPGDAVAIRIRIVGASVGSFKKDEWVKVTGKVYPVGEEVIVDAEKVQSVERPRHPYLS